MATSKNFCFDLSEPLHAESSSVRPDSFAMKHRRYQHYLNKILKSWHEVVKRTLAFSMAAAIADLTTAISIVLQHAQLSHVGNCNKLAMTLCLRNHAVQFICPHVALLHVILLGFEVRVAEDYVQEGQRRCCYCGRSKLAPTCNITSTLRNQLLSQMYHFQNAVPLT